MCFKYQHTTATKYKQNITENAASLQIQELRNEKPLSYTATKRGF